MAKRVFKDTSHDISEFESRLESALKPVRPPDEFVRDLRQKLLSQMEEGQRGKKLSTKNLYLLILTGMLSVVLVVATALRLIVSLLLGIKLFSRIRSSRDKKQTGPST